MKLLSRGVVFALLGFWWIPGIRAEERPGSAAQKEGASAKGLDRVKPIVEKHIKKGKAAGVVTLVARKGKIIDLETFGMMDVDAGKAMKADTIFRIYSMSKPITTVAAMILFDEGKFQLDDPVAKYLPEFKGLRVYQKEGEGEELKRPVSVRDLMRHTAGLTYGAFSQTPVDRMYGEKKVLDRNSSLAEMVEKLGAIPLLYQPGTHFHYSVAVDVLGRFVEVVSGKTLDEFFAERIFRPLDMHDTGFFVPEDKLERFAANYGPKEGGGLKVIDAPAKSPYRQQPKLLSGGGGLVSTGRDYLRFCQMMLNGGELEGTRILRKETVQKMTRNQLPKEAMPLSMGDVKRAGMGFGLGFSVRVAGGNEPGKVGEYGWGGAASTHFWISPKDNLIVIVLQQYMPYQAELEVALKPVIYEALKASDAAK